MATSMDTQYVVTCPRCGQEYEVIFAQAGQMTECETCAKEFMILPPETPAKDARSPADEVVPETAREGAGVRAALLTEYEAAKRKAFMWLCAQALVLLLGITYLCLALRANSRSQQVVRPAPGPRPELDARGPRLPLAERLRSERHQENPSRGKGVRRTLVWPSIGLFIWLTMLNSARVKATAARERARTALTGAE